MGATLILFVIGMAVGAGTGSAAAAFLVGVLGALVGMAGHAIGRMRAGLREIDPTIEHHAVMCFPYAQAADCAFVGDRNRGRWVDVTWCSRQHHGVECDKSCVPLMNLTRVRPHAA